MVIKKLILAISFLGIIATSFAQKLRYDTIHPLIEQEEYERALPLLLRFLERSPQHAFAYYQASKAFTKNMKALGPRQRALFEQTYDSARLMVEMGIYHVKKKELRKNKKYYEQELSVFDPTLSAVQLKYQEQLSEVNAYYAGAVQLFNAEERIMRLYQQSEQFFSQLIEPYSNIIHLQFKASGTLLDSLEQLQHTFDSIRFYQEVHRQGTQSAPFERFAKQYLLNEFEAYEVRAIPEEAFHGKLVVLYDYGSWANNLVKKLREEILPLRSFLPEANRRLEAILKAMDNGYFGTAMDAADLQQVYDLLSYDRNSLAARLLLYKQLKVEYKLLQANAKQSLDSLNIAVDSERLLKKIGECEDVLEHVKLSPLEVSKYQRFLDEAFGGKLGLEQYLAGERTYLREQRYTLLEGGGTQENGASMDLPTAKVQSLRPSSFVIRQHMPYQDSLWSAHGYMTAQKIDVPGGGGIVAGTCINTDQVHRDAFVARFDANLNVVWFRRLMRRKEGQVFDLQASNLSFNQQFTTLLGLEWLAGAAVQHQVLGISYEGELLFDKEVPLNKAVRSAILTNRKEQVLLVSKGKWRQDQFDRLEPCDLTLYNQFGEPLHQDSIVFKGILGQVLPTETGFVLAGNFLELQQTSGSILQSQALAKGGFNVFLAFLDEAGMLKKVHPITSERPIIATELVVEPSGSILLRGRQGSYFLERSAIVRGGELWEYRY